MGSKDHKYCTFDPQMVMTAALFFLMIGCLLLAVFASDNIPPYIYSRGFQSTRCVLQESQISANVCCQSAVTNIDDCIDKYVYPCGIMQVRYYRSGSLVDEVAVLYDGTHSASIVSPISRCSYHHCSQQSYGKRLEEVNDFLDTYNTSNDIQCYYNDEKSNVALLQVTTGTQLLHYLLWPIVLMMAAGAVCLAMVIYMKKVPQSTEDDSDEEDGDDEEEKDERPLSGNTEASDGKLGNAAFRPTTAGNVKLEEQSRSGQYKEESRANGLKSAKGKPQPVVYSPGAKPDEYKEGMDEGSKSPPAFFRTPSAVGDRRGSKVGTVENNFNRSSSNVVAKSMGKGASGGGGGGGANNAKAFNRNSTNTASMPEKRGKKTNGDIKMTTID